jgi:hypothetical protein
MLTAGVLLLGDPGFPQAPGRCDLLDLPDDRARPHRHARVRVAEDRHGNH